MAAHKVPVIRVACQGEFKQTIKEYQTYNLPPTHEIFELGEISQLSHLVGCRLLLQKIRPSLLQSRPSRLQPNKRPAAEYSSKVVDEYHPNPVASNLMVQLPALEPPAEWKDHVGSVLIARADKKALHPLHLTILFGFAQAAAQKHRADGTPFDQMLTPEQFRLYYPVALGHLKKDVNCPDDVENVAPLFDDVVDEQAMEVEGGGVQV